jgi:hypothetical protein
VFCPNRECPDFVESHIHGEYVDGVTVCPICGAALVEEVAAVRPAAPRLETEQVAVPETEQVAPVAEQVVAVAAFDTHDDAGPALELLAANGVVVVEFLDDGRDFDDQTDWTTCTRLLVPESHAAFAKRLIAESEG